MKTGNIQTLNFQGKAVYIKGIYEGYSASKEIEKAVKQLNRMNIIKDNDFNIFIEKYHNSLMVTAAKTKRDARKYGFEYKSPKATSMNTSVYNESIVGTAKFVALNHRQKLEQTQAESLKTKQTLSQKIKNLFTKK